MNSVTMTKKKLTSAKCAQKSKRYIYQKLESAMLEGIISQKRSSSFCIRMHRMIHVEKSGAKDRMGAKKIE